jgi:UDP-N-acetylglucosamine 2-epimerase (non-hydrolysing)
MKIAPFVHELAKYPNLFEHILIHTGQHYDTSMSQSFFDALNIPTPDIDMGIGSGSHAEQVGRTMIAFEKVVREWAPDWIVVVGDVNATCACAITAKKEHCKLAHIEAGLRSFDLNMPEEINRMVTDRLSDVLFTPDAIADRNLKNEGVDSARIQFAGNIMIDTMRQHLQEASELDYLQIIRNHQTSDEPLTTNPIKNQFALLTLHRPSNVDHRGVLQDLVSCFTEIATQDFPLVWSLHPRTKKQLEKFGLREVIDSAKNIITIHPVGYHEMLQLNMSSRIMLTDSGGLQEECCVLGTPCITLRDTTERPVTLKINKGLSVLVGHDTREIRKHFKTMINENQSPFEPERWDGHAAKRIVEFFKDLSLSPAT